MSEKVAVEKPVAPAFTLTAADLKEIIGSAVTAAVSEAKKTVLTDAEKARIEQDQQNRKELAANIVAEIENKKMRQRYCSHMRTGLWSGQTRAVHVENGNFMICQGCQGIIRPGTEPEGYKGTDIFDNALFYRLLQASQPVNMG